MDNKEQTLHISERLTPAKKKEIAAVLGPAYDIVLILENAYYGGKIPIIYGNQGMGKTGVLEPYLKSIENPPSFMVEVGPNLVVTGADLSQPVFFMTIRSQDHITEQVNNHIAEVKDAYPELDSKEFYEIEATFNPDVEHVERVLQIVYGSDLPALADPWFRDAMSELVCTLPLKRRMSAFMNGCEHLYESTNGVKKKRFKEILFSIKEKFRRKYTFESESEGDLFDLFGDGPI